MIIFSYICLALIIISLFVISLVYLENSNKKRISEKVLNFDKYIIVLEYHMQKAYEIVYKDKILIYSLDATKINDNEFNIASKDFAILVLKMIGPNLKEEFIELYGNEDTLIFNMIEYFNGKFESDEIRDKAKQNLFENTEDSIIKKEELN